MKMPKVDPIVVERFEEMLSKKFTPAANGGKCLVVCI